MRGHDACALVFVLAAIFGSIGHVTSRGPVTCDDIDFPCACETLTNVEADQPLLKLDCTGMELTRLPDMTPLRRAKIHRLDLGNNHIRFINDSAFAGLEFLPERQHAMLRLSSNNIEHNGISPNAFKGIQASEIILEMIDMKLETFPFQALRHIPSLTELKLGSNHLTFLPYNAFEGLYNLELLGLNQNPFKVLTTGTFRDQSESLKTLQLEETGMDEVPLNELIGLKRLFKLLLAKNKISYLPNGLLESLADTVREVEIDLSENQLTQIQYDVFARMDRRRKPIRVTLRLDANEIQSLSFIEDPCATMFRVGSLIQAHDNPVSCTCDLYSVVLTNYFLIDVVCENPTDYKGMLVYASPKRGLSEVSREYGQKVQQKCTGSNLQEYDLTCIKSKKPPAATSKSSPSSMMSYLKTPFVLLIAILLLMHLR